MKAIINLIAFFSLLFSSAQAWSQSAVYVYKNVASANAEYLCMHGMPDQREAEMLTQQKLEEMVNNDKMITKYASTGNKGYGMVIRSTITVSNGKRMPVFGAALGCRSFKEAETQALENLKTNNPDWVKSDYTVAYKFNDEE